MNLADKLKAKTRVKWTTLRGEKVGLRMLTRNEMTEHAEALENIEDDREVFAVFATQIVGADMEQALTVEEMDEVLTNIELKTLINEFNVANGLVAAEKEKNLTETH